MSSMVRASTILVIFAALASPAWAQITTTPGPGGIPIAPGPPVQGYTPGGVGIGGGKIAPGPAAGDVPMYRRGPGGVPLLVTPERNAEAPGGAGANAPGGTGTATASLGLCGRRPCLPSGLNLVVDSREAASAQARDATIDSVQGLRAALRACWTPPAEGREVQMSVRFSFRRSGELLGPPFVTYASRGASAQVRQHYRSAITAALDGCAPFRLSRAFAAAVAGQPISVRFVDHRAGR